VTLVDGDALLAEQTARREGERSGREYASPYNDPAVIAGQGTIAVELLRQLRASMPCSLPSAVAA
jgi:threonine dehydratase